jgi:hypothetical protein
MLFAFKRGGANSVDPFHRAIMQLNITPGQWLCTNKGQGFSAFVFHSPRMFRMTQALCRLTKPCLHNVFGGSRVCDLQLVKDVGRVVFCQGYPIPSTLVIRGFQAFHIVFVPWGCEHSSRTAGRCKKCSMHCCACKLSY